MGTAGSCYAPMNPPPPPLLLKDENSLLASGTGGAITAHVALSGGYLWKNININRGFHLETTQSCQVKKEGEHASVRRTQPSIFWIMSIIVVRCVKLKKLLFCHKT